MIGGTAEFAPRRIITSVMLKAEFYEHYVPDSYNIFIHQVINTSKLRLRLNKIKKPYIQ